MRLQSKGMRSHAPAEVLLRQRKKARESRASREGRTATMPNVLGGEWEVVRARGHFDEVQELQAMPGPGARPP